MMPGVPLHFFRTWLVPVALTAIGLASAAYGQDAIPAGSGNHVGSGRIVIDTPNPSSYELERDGDHIVARFTGPIVLQRAPSPQGVLSLKTTASSVSIVMKPGATLHPSILAGRVVFDIQDPADTLTAVKSAAADARPAPARVKTTAAQPRKAAAPSVLARSPELGGRVPAPTISAAALPRPPATAPSSSPREPTTQPAVATQAALPTAEETDDHWLEPAQPEAPGRDVLPQEAAPMRLLARRVRLPKAVEGTAFVVPFADTTGAAMFQYSGGTLIVFDERRPVDMSGLHDDPVFGRADVQLLPAGTLFTIPAQDGLSIALSQTPRGWRIAALKAEVKSQAILPAIVNGAMNLPAEQAGEVLTIADPDTAATLLVGTTRKAAQHVITARRTTEFILRPTGLGVVVEPLADAVTLKTTPTGFTIAAKPGDLAVSPQTATTEALIEAAHLTRRLDFPTTPTDALMRRLNRQVVDAALAPPQSRGPRRRGAALSMIALGMDAEAASVLDVAAAQDPREATSADTVALKAIAALLAGRTAEATGLDDPRLSGTDDISFWRAVRQATLQEGSPAAAAAFASTTPLALLYPKPIGDRVVPLAIETMIEGGALEPAAQLLAKRQDDKKLDYARAMLRQSAGDTDQALAQFDALANGRDQFDRARAAVRAVELRLSSGKLTAAEAADALDKLVYVWRGDQRELDLRERIAELRGQAGMWRTALSVLRQAEGDFPDQAAKMHTRLQDAFAGMLSGKGLDKMTPIDVVATVDENADLMSGKTADPALQEQLADQLLALELPDRARPVLDKLMKTAASPAAKARFGATLAAVDVREKDDAEAIAALDASEAPDLPPALSEKRTILRANALAHDGDPISASKLLATLGSPAANQALALILEQTQDWPAAQKAWSDYVNVTIPTTGTLEQGQARTLLRLTTATARANDATALAALREQYTSRLPAGPIGDIFRLLTSGPLKGLEDLKRIEQEVSLAQSLPAGLNAAGDSSLEQKDTTVQ